MRIKIKPFDTLIFRDGKPFGSGEDIWTNSNLFPSPVTIYGALRAAYFAQNPDEFPLANTSEDPTGDLTVTSIYFYHSDEETMLFPVPKDLVKEKNDDKNELFSLRLSRNGSTSSPLPYIFASDREVESAEGFLSDIALGDYLSCDGETFYSYSYDSLLKKEPKIGIGIDKRRRSVADGKLYRIDFHRYVSLELIVEFDGISLQSEGLLRLGGEGKAVVYSRWDGDNLPETKNLHDKRIKVYCLTPTIFEGGWLPDFIDSNSLEGYFNGVRLKLLAAAVGKTEYIGGWDIVRKQPKPMYKVVPAGSVYYFEIAEENDVSKCIDGFIGESISSRYRKEGFGRVLVGKVS
jgi:CRISPR-associated protein Cmr3